MRFFSRTGNKNDGFTLVELMLALVVSSVIMMAMYVAQRAQQRAHGSSEQTADLQQNIRAAMTVMTNDIHAAGFKPTGDDAGDIIDLTQAYLANTKFEIKEAASGRFAFTRYVKVLNDDGTGTLKAEKAQAVAYMIPTYWDADRNGVVDEDKRNAEPSPSLGRAAIDCAKADNDWCKDLDADDFSAASDPVARNIEALEFVYHMCPKDKDGLRYYSGQVKLDPAESEYEDICAVTVTLLMRSPVPDTNMAQGAPVPEPASKALYSLNNGAWPKIALMSPEERQHRRRLYTTTVQLRNTHLIKSN